MSSKALKRVTRNNRVVALPSKKYKDENGNEVQLYNIFMMK